MDVSLDDFQAMIKLVKDKKIDLTIVGPEAPLEKGIVDEFKKNGLAIIGCSQKASFLEASKILAKEFMDRHNIPNASYKVFEESLPKTWIE